MVLYCTFTIMVYIYTRCGGKSEVCQGNASFLPYADVAGRRCLHGVYPCGHGCGGTIQYKSCTVRSLLQGRALMDHAIPKVESEYFP